MYHGNLSLNHLVDSHLQNEKLFSDFAVFGFVENNELFSGTQVKKGLVNAEQNNDFIRVVSITNKANRTYKDYKYLKKYDLIITEAHTILKYKNNLIKSEV